MKYELSKPSLKRYCRLMECAKKDNSYELSFLVSSKRNFSIILNDEEFKIFNLMDGNNSIIDIKNELNIDLKKIKNLIQKFENKNLIEFNIKEKNKNVQFDRHDLFFDMYFEIEDFTKKIIDKKRILIIGAGGIGNNILLLLSRMGFKNFIICDNDNVELSNLTRQFLFDKSDIGKNKILVLKNKLLNFDSNIKISLINQNFSIKTKDIILKHSKEKKIDFCFVSADSPPSIAIDAYNILTDINIPYTTVGYLNDFAIFGPTIDSKNFLYEKFISTIKTKKRNSNYIKEHNKSYQSPSFGPINMFSASNAVSDMIRYFAKKDLCISLNKKIIFNYNLLEKQIIDFSNINKKKIDIGIFSSSSDLGYKYQDRVLKAVKILEENGFNINLGCLWNKSIGYTTASAKQRGDEFNNLAKNNKILMSMIGGYNSSSILSYIDYNLIKKNKTKVIGFSDTTSILLAIYNKTKLPVYYGPALLPSIDEQEYIKNWNIKQIKDFVIGDKKNIINPDFWTDEKIDWSKYNGKTEKKLYSNKLESINNSIIEGRLIGGNLNTIVSIYNTEFMPKIKEGDILFIEDSLKSIDECERNFAFLKNSKILDKISGVIIGKIEGFDPKNSNETYESLFLKFLDRKIPVLMKFDCSHCHPMNILKIGSRIRLNTFNNTIEYI